MSLPASTSAAASLANRLLRSSAGAALICKLGLVAIRSLRRLDSPTWTRTRRFLLAEVRSSPRYVAEMMLIRHNRSP